MEGRILPHWQAHLKALLVVLLVYAPSIMEDTVLVNVYQFERVKQLFRKYAGIDEPSAITFRSLIQNKVVEQNPDIIFDPDDHIIPLSSEESDAMDLLDIPMSTVFPTLQCSAKKVKMVTDTSAVASSSGAPTPPVNLMDENESVLTTLNSSHTLDDAHDFQQRFNNRKIGREAFLNKNVP